MSKNLSNERLSWLTRARLSIISIFNRERHGFTVAEGVGVILAGIFAVIFLYFVAYAVPGALVAIATTALTSVNPGVQTIFQVLFSIVAVFTFLLILIAVVQKVIG